ncbi:MAG: hypothetical protein JW724_03675 [Candidatus Altiarchaeota archaeon]|nr:hypothetical protein [Candidatus Altiarchaeota archaeon]
MVVALLFCGCTSTPEMEESAPETEIVVEDIETPVETTDLVVEEEKSSGITMAESFAVLRSRSGIPDLAFFSYQGFGVDSEGRTDDYVVAGYSAVNDDVIFLRSDGKEIKINTVSEPAEGSQATVDNLVLMKDTSEMVAEALAENPECPEGINVMVSPVRGKAVSLLCSSARWSYETSLVKPSPETGLYGSSGEEEEVESEVEEV